MRIFLSRDLTTLGGDAMDRYGLVFTSRRGLVYSRSAMPMVAEALTSILASIREG